MQEARLTGGVIGTAIDDWGPKLVAIPAGYAIGAWLGALYAIAANEDREARADRRDSMGAAGGLTGLVVWLVIAFVVH